LHWGQMISCTSIFPLLSSNSLHTFLSLSVLKMVYTGVGTSLCFGDSSQCFLKPDTTSCAQALNPQGPCHIHQIFIVAFIRVVVHVCQCLELWHANLVNRTLLLLKGAPESNR
jgi:hypothetical protein